MQRAPASALANARRAIAVERWSGHQTTIDNNNATTDEPSASAATVDSTSCCCATSSCASALSVRPTNSQIMVCFESIQTTKTNEIVVAISRTQIRLRCCRQTTSYWCSHLMLRRFAHQYIYIYIYNEIDNVRQRETYTTRSMHRRSPTPPTPTPNRPNLQKTQSQFDDSLYESVANGKQRERAGRVGGKARRIAIRLRCRCRRCRRLRRRYSSCRTNNIDQRRFDINMGYRYTSGMTNSAVTSSRPSSITVANSRGRCENNACAATCNRNSQPNAKSNPNRRRKHTPLTNTQKTQTH